MVSEKGDADRDTMDSITKVKRQFAINITVLLVSVLLIILAVCFRNYKTSLSWEMFDGIGVELVFTMAASLGSVIGWRFVEEIKRKTLYKIFLTLTVVVLCLEYGWGIAAAEYGVTLNRFLILGSVFLFVFFFCSEQLAILKKAAENETKNPEKNSLAYREGEEEKA